MASISILSSFFSSNRTVKATFHLPKVPRVNFTAPILPTAAGGLVEDFKLTDSSSRLLENNFTNTTKLNMCNSTTSNHRTMQLYSILEAVADRVEMHKNVGEQRDNWNNLLLNNINMITLTATTLAGVASATTGDEGAPLLALKLSSTLLFSAATGMLLIMNKIQPSQLAEEQRIATRLFKQLQTQVETTIAIGNPTEEDVKCSIDKVLALDKAYPLPLLGVMIEKFPKKYEPAVWWPVTNKFERKSSKSHKRQKDETMLEKNRINGWSEELEMELREVVEVVKSKDIEDYERLGNIALKVNKALAITGPLLTGIAAVGSSFVGHGSWAANVVPLMAGSLAAVINALEHGGQVGMVFEMYRNCGGFFQLLEETIETTLEENDLNKRENGELFEMKMALQLGRSVSQLRELASKSASYRSEGIATVDEFASKLF